MPEVHAPFGRSCGRSMVIHPRGIAATSQVLASQAGAKILAMGGSAADAAIAANAVLGVVEPMMNGLGGDLFVLYWDKKSGTLTGLNASGPAPRGHSPDVLKARGLSSMPGHGIHSVTVSGVVDGWAKMHGRFGRLAWKSLFESAICHAEEGFLIPEVLEALWSAPAALERLGTHPESLRVFLPEGRPPRLGSLFRNKDLAAALRILASEGPDAFYRGTIANAILDSSRALGGTMEAQDLASYSSEWVEPISIDYRGWRVIELPPNGQGMAALEMLNIMDAVPGSSQFPFDAPEMHKRIEAMKLAYADLHRYNADPRRASVPVELLISKEYARQQAAAIDPMRANRQVTCGQLPGSDTVYLSVVDREGNIASWIQSVFNSFGSGITVNGMGFVLQNRGAGFTLDPAHPNVLAGGKRPFHTIIPGFMEHGDAHIGFGIMGGANQPLAHAQFVSNVVDYGMNLQQALEAPRFFKASASGCDVAIETRVGEATLKLLSEMGHDIALRPQYCQEMGRGQAVMHDSRTRANYAGSDPRADGAAIPEPS